MLMCLYVSACTNVCVCACVTRAFCPAELGPALMSLTALTWRCCLWWLNRFSPYREVCAVFFFFLRILASFPFDLCISWQYTRHRFGVFSRVKMHVFDYKEMQYQAKAICVGWPAELQAQLCSA